MHTQNDIHWLHYKTGSGPIVWYRVR